MAWPKISVIVPAYPGTTVQALAVLQAADYPPGQLEVLVAEGNRPSRQRNAAARQASGDVLYFLDDDSLVAPDTLQRLAAHYRTAGAQAVGGPSLTPGDEPLLSRCIGYALGTRLGAWTMRARYASVGRCRLATEKELIGCNLSVRRDAFWAVGGFREDMFPNEETELVNRLRRCGCVAVYDPGLVVWRAQRRSLAALARQFFSYGRGRMQQIVRAFPHSGLAFLMPAVGLLYMALSPVLWGGLGPWALLPMVTYLMLVFSVSMYLGVKHRMAGYIAVLPVVFGAIHACYGCGLLYETLVQWTQFVYSLFDTGRPSRVVTRLPEVTSAEK